MAEKWTPQQREAVHNRGGKLLVSAAAGSGKTKVLVDRLMVYLLDPADPANLDEFLIITYTKAAASELRGKIAAKLTEKIAADPQNRHLQKQMQRLYLTKISTVHGFCSDILREYAYRLNIPADFRVADENECRELRDNTMDALLDQAYQSIGSNGDFRAFADTQGLGRDDRLVPEIIEKVYDSARCHLDPQAWLHSALDAAQEEDALDASQTVWGSFLMEDLFAYLDCQIGAFQQCKKAAQEYPEMANVCLTLDNAISQFEILRTAEDWDTIFRNHEIEYKRLTFPRKNPDLELTERIRAVWNGCKATLGRKLQSFTNSSESVLTDHKQAAAATRGLIALVEQFEKDYTAMKRSRRCLDFSDLEQKTLDLLLGKDRSGSTVAAKEIAGRFREIMVDEYQDSNGVQDAIFSALTERKQNGFLVGDVKQSIYQFRLADPGIFLEKYNQYVSAEKAEAGQGRKVLLSHNFRSGPEIMEAVNDVFSACMRPTVGGLFYGEGEALREWIPRDPLPDPAVELCTIDVREETYPEEAAFVADKIYDMLQSGTLIRQDGQLRPVRPEDIVILLRSPGSAASYFQTALESRGIRCASGNGTELLKTQEVATVRTFLQTILNPRQDIPLISTLASPIFGFTADDLASIRARNKGGCFYDALLGDEREKTVQFLLTLSQLRTEVRMNTLTGLLEKCFSLTRWDSIYGSMPGGDAKAANLQVFYQLAVEFEKGSLRDLAQFLDHLEALEGRGLPGAGNSSAGCVTIMSIHKSKGLEFPVVFLCNLSRKFNRENLRAQILCDKTLGLGLSVVDREKRIRYPSVAKKAIAVKAEAESLSEEMRVLYVAMTRARDRLIMTYASRKLADVLKNTAMRMDLDHGELLCRDALCMGDWVLLAALKRMEAGELHALGGRPQQTSLNQYPWQIRVCEAPINAYETKQELLPEEKLPESVTDHLKRQLSFSYSYEAATTAPSKQTATGRKGRHKDAEAEENTDAPSKLSRVWRKPAFAQAQREGIAFGKAIHTAMQYIRYENCGSKAAVAQEINRLVAQGFLSQEQGLMVDCDRIAALFGTEIGRKLCNGIPCLREFKFSILDDGKQYNDSLAGEQVLLQGVVDCAVLEEDGITVLDFKTDKVTDKTLDEIVSVYRPQVETYAEALSRIYEMPVKAKYLYFFRLDRFVSV